MPGLTRARSGALVAIILALGVPLGLHVAQRLSEVLTGPSLAEIEKHRSTLGGVIRVDLVRTARLGKDGTRRVSLPAAWTGAGGPVRAPWLLVFVDGAPVRFDRQPWSDADPAESAAYYVPLDRRRVVLALRCGREQPCRSAVVIRDGRRFQWALAVTRLVAHPGWLLLALTGVVLWAVVAVHLVARAGTRELALAAAFGSLPLAAWLLGGGSARLWSDGLLLIATLAFGAPFLRAVVTDARAGWGREALDALEQRAATLGQWLASARGEKWSSAVILAVAVTLFLPLAVRGRTFFIDWANHLYYAERQADVLRELHRPSYFLHSMLSGAFYPYFAFYGGTLYALTGLFGIAIGSVGAAYVAMLGLGFAMAFMGTAWLGRQAGLPPSLALLTGLVVVSSAYYLTNAYGRGSWAELIATSAVAPVAAAAAALVWGPKVRRRDAAMLFLAAVLFSGSHTITLVWGSAFLAFLLFVTWPSRAAAGVSTPWRRVGLAGAVIALAIGVNAWFLAPALAYGRATHIGGYAARGFGSDTQFLNVPAVLFHPGRWVPPQSGTPGLYTQVSVYVLGWVAAAALVLYRRPASAPLRWAWTGLALLLGLFFWLIGTGRLDPPWILIPRLFKIVQFQFRLHTYVTYSLAGLVIVTLLASRAARRPALWVTALVAALAVQVGLGEYQAWTARTYYPISEITSAGVESPPTLLEAHDYRFVEHPDVQRLGETVFSDPVAELRVDLHGVRADRLEVAVQGDGLVQTDIVYSPLIETAGDLVIAGRTTEGWTVLRSRTPGPTAHEGAIVPARPLPVAIGVTVSVASFVAALLLLARLGRTEAPSGDGGDHGRAPGAGGGASRAG